MDFSWSDEQERVRKSVIEFTCSELGDTPRVSDDGAEFNHSAWRACADFGIHGLPMPQQYGGSELDALTVVYALEGLGYGCRDNGLIFSINAHMWSCAQPILTYGTEVQREQFLPGLCSGELIGGNATTEPESGSDAFSLTTTAERRGDHYVLNGNKVFCTNGPVADLLVVYATVDRSQGQRGVTAFLVEKGTGGLSVGRAMDKMGLRTSPLGEVGFTDCEIPIENRLGVEGGGVAIFTHSMEWERSFILASAVGAMQRQLEECIAYARDRKQFGQSIGKFQSVSSKIVDMKLRLETARSLLYRVAWLKSRGRQALMASSMAKLYISECWTQSSLDAIQIHGGYGYMTEMGIERDLRDAIGSRLYSGTSEIQRNIIAQFLGL
jgi:alkylation response protein AidB-like acyl-CoA dehydrogenase